MVSFICNACGQTVRKTQVEKHYQNDCRNCNVLSCIDCGKDFHGDEYVGHTSCISEAEKYQGKLYKPKDKSNKGEHKQQEWLKQVREATRSDKADPRLTVLLERISEYSNIPRKKAKFQNFCKNSINVRDSSTLDKLWEIFSESTKKSPQESEPNSNGVHEPEQEKDNESQVDEVDKDSKKTKKEQKDNELEILNDEEESKGKKNKKSKDSKKQKKGEKLKDIDIHESVCKSKGKKSEKDSNGNTDNMDASHNRNKKRQKRRKSDDEEERDESPQSKVSKAELEETVPEKNHFNWKSTIKAVLRQAPDQELPVKRLRKKILAEFQARGANEKNLTDNELRALFEKKITKNPKFKVHKDRVKLVK
ncbi:cell growth-regulating nucleolar protein-like isoform X2 [Orbicella faveolata]|uniref:cell growth-regulating nucleolar protein-like isoform X2 n=1 Tax=Orbicella faveolata TaxID=48498 RepID=UPI0009E20CF8|nr:cell growth-regulating nucleolar protein-like isoform X2 [Orbicella faveolata]